MEPIWGIGSKVAPEYPLGGSSGAGEGFED